MPPRKAGNRLSPAEVDVLTRWVQQGARYAEHWALIPPKAEPCRRWQTPSWPRNGIDFWILARLEKEGLHPSPEADPYTLLRRASLDLRGLPPTPQELERFLSDKAPGAYERAVDRFLDDPAYGERWARMWLDLARYADSAGYGSDPLRTIWRYRDWVIDAFNRNLPYDQFTIEQIAGDLLPDPTLDQKMATAFHRNTMTNTEGGTDDEEFRVAAIKDRVDTTMQVWMGLTMGCAKCHSHKYDPLTNEEYYKFYAIFNQTADTRPARRIAGDPGPDPGDQRAGPQGRRPDRRAEGAGWTASRDPGTGHGPGDVGGEDVGRSRARRGAEGRAQGDPGDPRHAGRQADQGADADRCRATSARSPPSSSRSATRSPGWRSSAPRSRRCR